jgi:septal ring factor EnvC (AmiA/AmiB activator)
MTSPAEELSQLEVEIRRLRREVAEARDERDRLEEQVAVLRLRAPTCSRTAPEGAGVVADRFDE